MDGVSHSVRNMASVFPKELLFWYNANRHSLQLNPKIEPGLNWTVGENLLDGSLCLTDSSPASLWTLRRHHEGADQPVTVDLE